MNGRRELRCPSGCEEGRFEALNAPLFVDRAGRYLDHDAGFATYVCSVCQSVAIDLSAARREMRRSGTEPQPVVLSCPVCANVMPPLDDDPLAGWLECPACDSRFSREEATSRRPGGDAGEGW